MTTFEIWVFGALVFTCLAMALLSGWWVPRQQERLVRDSLVCLSSAIEMRFAGYHGSTVEVVRLALELGRRIGLTSGQLRRLEQAAWAQDIGLSSVPYALLNHTPMEHWTEADHAIYARHPEVGGAMLELIPNLEHLAHIVRHHHGAIRHHDDLSHTGLCVEARVLSLVNSYLWHANELGVVVAKDHIQTESGRLFDAKMVDELLRMVTCASESVAPTL